MMRLLDGGVMDVWKDETLPSSQVGGSRKKDLRYWPGSRKYFIMPLISYLYLLGTVVTTVVNFAIKYFRKTPGS